VSGILFFTRNLIPHISNEKIHSSPGRLLLFAGASSFTLQAQGTMNTNKTASSPLDEALSLTSEWDKVFPQSDRVEHRKVTFHNHFGLTLAADLYLPKGATGKLPAIAVCGLFGGVKEQSSGLYAQTLAERGFITLAFDPSFTGESGGHPRRGSSPLSWVPALRMPRAVASSSRSSTIELESLSQAPSATSAVAPCRPTSRAS